VFKGIEMSRWAVFFSLLTLSVGIALLFAIAVGAVQIELSKNGQPGMVLQRRWLIFALVLCMASALYALWSIIMRQLRAYRDSNARFDRRAVAFQKQTIEAHCILCVISRDGCIERVNANFHDAFGFEPGEIEGQSWQLLLDSQANTQICASVERSIAHGGAWTGELFLARKNGESMVANISLAPENLSDRPYERTLMLVTDITRNRMAERDHFLSTTLEELHDEIYVYEADTLHIRYLNRAARRRCGWTPETAKTQAISDTLPDFNVALFRKHTQPLLSGKKETVMIELTHPAGAVEVATRLTKGADGKKQFVSVLRDLAHRKEIEDAKIETVSMISHELRAPLTSMKGSLRLLQSGQLGALSEQAAQIVEIANKNSDRLLFIIGDILDLEKIRAGKMEMTLDEIDLVDVAHDAVELNGRYADGFNVAIETGALPQTAKSVGDHNRLVQVLTNLLTNAVKHSPESGTVRLGLSRDGDAWRFSVADDGPGIPEDKRHLIGRPFAQLAGADGQKREGTGLGLSIVKKILRKHGAKLYFDSKVGGGTAFYFSLPDRGCGAPLGHIANGEAHAKVVPLEAAAAQGRG